ncbi:MAG: aminomethyl-transferring glycine dehydrogenase subunit GcvPA [Gammaproteobacteria bacterium]
MPFIPHTAEETAAMLEAIGETDLEALFDEIPARLRAQPLEQIAPMANEMEIDRLLRQRASDNHPLTCFMGAGAYDHHIPAAVWELTTRGEFYSAYTPYQAEASQGTLQLIYEFQTMIAGLTGLEAANASLYEGASALAEAVLMAVRSQRKKVPRVLLPRSLHPRWRETLTTLTEGQAIELVELDFDDQSGELLLPESGGDFAALIIAQPNFFGLLEQVDQLTDWAHDQGALVIAAVNPISLALLKPPGEWGQQGADIAFGEGQPLGIPLASGGPYFGFMACKKTLVRQMPGRIVGRTLDTQGRTGYTLTLQAREQHIRRGKATSNICTNQGLMATAATLHMAIMGKAGLRQVALSCHQKMRQATDALLAIPGVSRRFSGTTFHETLFVLPKSVTTVLEQLRTDGLLGGYAVEKDYPELTDGLLVCTTEKRTDEDISRLTNALSAALK